MKVIDGEVYAVGHSIDLNSVGTIYIWKESGASFTEVARYEGHPKFEPRDLAIADGKFYVAGTNNTGEPGNMIASLLVNGVRTDLDKGRANTVTVVGGKVYVGGLYGDLDDDTAFACVWTDGLRNIVSKLPGAYVTSFSVESGKVYAHGGIGNGRVAAIWADDLRTELPEFGEKDIFVAVSDDKVFITSSYGDEVSLWTDGVISTLSSTESRGNIVAAENGKAYVGGFYYDGTHDIAAVWTDDRTITEVAPPASTGNSEVTSLAISEGKIYASGNYDDSGTHQFIWADGAHIPIDAANSEIRALTVSGGITYAGGGTYNGSYSVATLWVDGQRSFLETQSSGVYAVLVHNGKVYAAGSINTFIGSDPVLWIDGSKEVLPAGKYGEINALVASKGRIYAGGASEDDDYGYAAIWTDGNLKKLDKGQVLSIAIAE